MPRLVSWFSCGDACAVVAHPARAGRTIKLASCNSLESLIPKVAARARHAGKRAMRRNVLSVQLVPARFGRRIVSGQCPTRCPISVRLRARHEKWTRRAPRRKPLPFREMGSQEAKPVAAIPGIPLPSAFVTRIMERGSGDHSPEPLSRFWRPFSTNVPKVLLKSSAVGRQTKVLGSLFSFFV